MSRYPNQRPKPENSFLPSVWGLSDCAFLDIPAQIVGPIILFHLPHTCLKIFWKTNKCQKILELQKDSSTNLIPKSYNSLKRFDQELYLITFAFGPTFEVSIDENFTGWTCECLLHTVCLLLTFWYLLLTLWRRYLYEEKSLQNRTLLVHTFTIYQNRRILKRFEQEGNHSLVGRLASIAYFGLKLYLPIRN